MARELTYAQNAERSIIKTYRKSIWNPFVEGCKRYELIRENDVILVCLDGTAGAVVAALCLKQLKRVSDTSFEVLFKAENETAKAQLEVLGLKETGSADYNKTAFPVTLNDVVDNTLYNMFCNSSLEGIIPNKDGVIMPLFCVYDSAINNFAQLNKLKVVDKKQSRGHEITEKIKLINPDIEHNVFTSLHNVKLDTIVEYN